MIGFNPCRAAKMNGVSVDAENSAEPAISACIDSRPVGKSMMLRSTPACFQVPNASATNVTAQVYPVLP
jgi:hypothetical protein